MDLDEIKSLLDMLEGTDVTEIDIEDENKKLRIKKGAVVEESLPVVQPEKHNTDSEVDLTSEEESEKMDNLDEIVAPMVGTFYRAPAPDADPFVEIGDVIKAGDTLCIIEAMKLMNEIEAETKGKIVEILVENSEPVEYGQPLFKIELL